MAGTTTSIAPFSDMFVVRGFPSLFFLFDFSVRYYTLNFCMLRSSWIFDGRTGPGCLFLIDPPRKVIRTLGAVIWRP